MENSIVQITTGPLHDIGRKIFAHLDAKELMKARATCTAWYNLIESSPKLWPTIVKQLRRKYLLTHPLWKQVQAEIPTEQYIELGYHLMEYKSEAYRDANLSLHEHHCFAILYGNLERLQFFWPYLQNKAHPSKILDFVAHFGLTDILKFLLKNLKNLDIYLIGSNNLIGTPLHEAATYGHFETVQALLPYYKTLPINGHSKCPVYCALESKKFKTAQIIKNWFGTKCNYPVKCDTNSRLHQL